MDLGDDALARTIEMIETEGYVGERWQQGLAWLRELRDLRAARRVDAERVRAVVREILAAFTASDGPVTSEEEMADIADRVVAQLTDPPPGHVCLVSHGLGPEDLDEIEAARNFVERHDGFRGTVDRLDKILAAHRAPGATS